MEGFSLIDKALEFGIAGLILVFWYFDRRALLKMLDNHVSIIVSITRGSTASHIKLANEIKLMRKENGR